MTRETFEKILENKKILWNDIVKIEVFNPNYRKTILERIPKTITFEGALGYHRGDNSLDICAYGDDGPSSTKFLYFDFEQILNIEKIIL